MSQQPPNKNPATASLHATVKDRFGVLPHFFRLGPEAPEVTENLWGFAKFGYLDNPLPSLFKERLFVYLSRFCDVRYCIARHVGFLVGLGHPSGDSNCPPETIEQVVRLISRELPRGAALEPHLALLESLNSPLQLPLQADTPIEEAVFACATHVFLQTPQATKSLEALRRVFDGPTFQHFLVFLAFVRTAHFWTKVHPELKQEDDISNLLNVHSALAQCVQNDPEAADSETTQELLHELATLRREREQAELLRTTLSSIGDAVITTDNAGRVTNLNAVAEALTGWNCSDAIGQPLDVIFRIINEQTRSPVENPADKALREGVIVGLANHTLLIAKDGSEKPIDDSAAPIRDRNGEIFGCVLVFRDVTEKRAAEIEQGRLAALVDSSNDAILGLSLEGNVTDWNRGAERLFGYSAEEMVGRSIFSTIVPHDRRDETFNNLQRLQKGERIEQFETIRLKKDESIVPVSINISPILDREGHVVGASAIDRDITSQWAANHRRNARLAVTEILAYETNVGTAISKILATVGNELAWEVGCFWRISPSHSSLQCCDYWQQQSASLDVFRETTAQLSLEPGGSLPGRVWVSGKPTWVQDLSLDEQFSRANEAEAGGLKSAFACPVSVGQKFLGVTEWFSRTVREPDMDLLEMMTSIGSQIGLFIERREAENNLVHSEQHLNDFFENASVGLHWVGADGTILRVNQAELDLLGYTRDEYVGRHLADFHADQPVIENILRCLSAGEELKDYEARLRCKDGSIRHVLIDSNVLWEQGEFVHSRCFTRDITERKQAETALQDSEERLRLALDAARMGSWEWHIPSERVVWSATLEKIHGLPVGGFDGTFEAYQRDIHPEDRERVLTLIRKSVESGNDHHLQYRIIWPDESVHWLEARGKLFKDAQGQPLRLIGVCSDITERKQLEQSLHFLAEASKSLSMLVDYRSTLQNIANLAVPQYADWCTVDIVDPDGSLQRLAVAHVDPKKVKLAEDLLKRYPPKPDAPRGVMNVLRTGHAEYMHEIPANLLEDSAQDAAHAQVLRELALKSYMCVPLRVQNEVIGVITFVAAESGKRYLPSDLAMAEELAIRASVAIDNSRLYQQLRDADRRKDEFLAMLAHELRNPLAPIRSGLDILAMEDSGHQETISLMQEQVEHLVRLVDDLLDVSRIMRGKVDLRKETIDLRELVRRSVNVIDPLVADHQQELQVFAPDSALHIFADPVRIVQVIENLLNNASKYMDAGGKIELHAERQGNDAVVVVRDQGIGIERELLPHVFDLFTQSSRTLDRAQGGLGIGLTLVKRLVELHDGNVTAYSSGIGEGSTFSIRLPLAIPDDNPQPSPHQVKTSVNSRRILVVDDNVGAARLLTMLLTKLGDHEVISAHDGQTALERVHDIRPEIVLLDIGLPLMNGYQVASEIRANRVFDEILLVALTGYGQEEDRRKSKNAGFDEHVVKPPSVEQMKQLLLHPKLTTKADSSTKP
jgi:PAS domain S-box-containing protein